MEPAREQRGAHRRLPRNGFGLESGEALGARRTECARTPAETWLPHGTPGVDRRGVEGSPLACDTRRAAGSDRRTARAHLRRRCAEALTIRGSLTTHGLEREEAKTRGRTHKETCHCVRQKAG